MKLMFLLLFGCTLIIKATVDSISHYGDDIVVVGTVPLDEFAHRYDEIGEIQFDTEEIMKLPTLGEADVSRALKYVSGVSAANENSAELVVHGSSPEQNLTILDGIPLYSLDHFFGFFSPFASNAIANVKLYKSFYPAWYGNRLASVQEYESKNAPFDTLKSSIALSMLSLAGSVETPLGSKVSLLLAGRRSYTDLVQTPFYERIFHQFSREEDFKRDLGNFQLHREPSFHFYDWNGKIRAHLTERDSLIFAYYQGKDNLTTLSQAHGFDRIQLFPSAPDSWVPRAVDVQLSNRGEWGNRGSSVRWFHRWNHLWETMVMGGYSRFFFSNNEQFHTGAEIGTHITDTFSARFEKEQSRESDNTIADLFGQVRATATSAFHTVELGIEAKEIRTTYTQQESFSDLTGEEGEPTVRIYDSLATSDLKQRGRNLSLWVQDQFRPGDAFTIVTALRALHYFPLDTTVVSPRTSLLWNPTESISLRGNWGIYYQTLHRAQMYDLYLEGDRYFWLLAAPEEAPLSRSMKQALGISVKPWGILLDIEGYYTRQYGLTHYRESYTPSAASYSEGSGWIRGLDCMIQKKIGLFTGWISYAYTESIRQHGKELNYSVPFYVPHDNRHELKLISMIDFDHLSLAATWLYASGAPTETPVGTFQPDLFDHTTATFGIGGWKGSERKPPYHRLDLAGSVRWTMGRSLKGSLTLSLFNLYNRKNIREYRFEHKLDSDGKEVSSRVIYRSESYYLGIVPSASFTLSFIHPRGADR